MNAQDFLDDLYAEGDRDILSFNFIGGAIAYDVDDVPYGKSDSQIFSETLKIIDYLLATDDFSAGCMMNKDGVVELVVYSDGTEGFSKDARNFFEAQGLGGDGLSWGLVLKKIKIGTAAPVAPEFLQALV